jgi:hypothetical protein
VQEHRPGPSPDGEASNDNSHIRRIAANPVRKPEAGSQEREVIKNVVPFKAPDTFARLGIDWTRAATTQRQRLLREAFLTQESSCGMSGLVSLLLLAVVSRRQGVVAEDLKAAADFAEVILAMELRKHQDDTLAAVQSYVDNNGPLWS